MSSREVISFAGGVILVGAGADLVITGFVVVATFLFGNQGNEEATLFVLVAVTGGVTVGVGVFTVCTGAGALGILLTTGAVVDLSHFLVAELNDNAIYLLKINYYNCFTYTKPPHPPHHHLVVTHPAHQVTVAVAHKANPALHATQAQAVVLPAHQAQYPHPPHHH